MLNLELPSRIAKLKMAINRLTFLSSSAAVFFMCFLFFTQCPAHPGFDFGRNNSGGYNGLSPDFYELSCPQADDIVMFVLEKAIANDPRMGASLLRLHFHDCFAQGCDGSVLLDNSDNIVSEKQAAPNANSLRGWEVIDEIKAQLEGTCPETVSCADILSLAARGSVVLSGGPSWELPLGRRDSTTANLNLANSSIPGPTFSVQRLITFFRQQGLDEGDLVALSGGHTIGMARCRTFKERLYDQNGNSKSEQPDLTLERNYYNDLKSVCPPAGGDNNISPLDYTSPMRFDNTYFKLVLEGRGLLFSDETLLTGNAEIVVELVRAYAEDEGMFFDQFGLSMVKMGSIGALVGSDGEVRRNCRRVNP